MASLSSLLVERGVVEMRAVEDAIARQVVYGGDFVTNLLEVAAPDEEAVLELAAELAQLPPAPSGKLLALPEIVALLPRDRAVGHGIFPLARTQNVLVVAVAQPLPTAVEEELAFALGVDLRQLLALWVRVREALTDYYHAPLERRAERLLARLAGEAMSSRHPPPMPAEPDLRLPKPESIAPPTFGSGSPVLSSSLRALSTPRMPRVVVASEPAALVAPSAEGAGPEPATEIVEESPQDGPTAAPVEAPQASGAAPEASPVVDVAEASRGATMTPESVGRRRVAALERARASMRIRHKGPLTLARAEEELRDAAAGDVVLGAFFDFSRQFFQFTALFVVHGELADGRDVHGPGVDREAIASVSVGLGSPGLFANVRSTKSPIVAQHGTESDAEVLASLGRPADERRLALIPLVVRDKVVAVLFGDDGKTSVKMTELGDVVSLAALASRSLEALIVRKKGGRQTTLAVPPPPPKVRDKTSENALRALAVTAREEAVAKVPTEGLQAPLEAGGSAALPERSADAVERPAAPAAALTVSPAAESIRAPVPLVAPEPAPAQAPVNREAPTSPDSPERKRRITQDLEPAPQVRPESTEETAGTIGDALSRIAEKAPPIPLTPKPRPPSQPPAVPGYAPVAAPAAASPDPGRRSPSDPPAGANALPAVPRRKTLSGMPALTGPEHQPDALSPSERVPANEVEEGPRVASDFTPSPVDHPASALEPPLPLVARRVRVWPPLPREEEEEATPAPRRREAITRRDAPPVKLSSSTVARAADRVEEHPGHAEVAQKLAAFLASGAHGKGDGDDTAFSELVREGDRLVPVLMAQFPGPLRVDRHRARDQLPAASQCGPGLELVVALRRLALPLVTVRTSSPDVEVRFWATHALGELRYPEAATALLPRLFDDDASVRRIARRSATTIVAAGDPGLPLLAGLDHMTRDSSEATARRRLAIETLGEIRAPEAVVPLVSVLNDPSEDVADAARRALLVVTRQDFGREGRRWLEWWDSAQHRHRIEWLIDALMHELPSIRRAAGDELKQLTKVYFGYYDDLPKRERERAQQRYREWWDKEGRERFS